MELNPELVPALGGGCSLPPAGRPLPAVMQKQYTLSRRLRKVLSHPGLHLFLRIALGCEIPCSFLYPTGLSSFYSNTLFHQRGTCSSERRGHLPEVTKGVWWETTSVPSWSRPAPSRDPLKHRPSLSRSGSRKV